MTNNNIDYSKYKIEICPPKRAYNFTNIINCGNGDILVYIPQANSVEVTNSL